MEDGFLRLSQLTSSTQNSKGTCEEQHGCNRPFNPFILLIFFNLFLRIFSTPSSSSSSSPSSSSPSSSSSSWSSLPFLFWHFENLLHFFHVRNWKSCFTSNVFFPPPSKNCASYPSVPAVTLAFGILAPLRVDLSVFCRRTFAFVEQGMIWMHMGGGRMRDVDANTQDNLFPR